MTYQTFPNLIAISAFATAVLLACNENGAAELAPPSPQAQTQTSPPAPATGGGMMQQLRAGCPMAVQGADLAVSDTDKGVALTFTTTAGNVEDLRARVRHMAAMYERHRAHRGMMWHPVRGQGQGGRGRGGPGMGHMGGKGPMPAVTSTVIDVDNGARLELQPADASQLDSLRQHARWHEQRMESGECWMLQGQAPAQERDSE